MKNPERGGEGEGERHTQRHRHRQRGATYIRLSLHYEKRF